MPRFAPFVLVLAGSVASAQVKPYILFDFDTSGSMLADSCGAVDRDDTVECPGSDSPCASCNVSGCGDGLLNDSRLWKVKRATTDVVSAFGEVTFGLARFHQTPAPFACKGGGWLGAAGLCGFSGMGVGDNAADILVDFADGNQRDILDWLDRTDNYTGTPPATGCNLCPATGDCGGGCDKELRGTGGTPVAGSLFSVEQHLAATRMADPLSACRPYGVILLTDGADNCLGDPEDQAASLCASGVPVYSIGFGTCLAGCNDPCFDDCPGSTCPTSSTAPPDGCFTEGTLAHACITDCPAGCQLFCQTNEIAELGCGPACDTSATGQTLCDGTPIVVDNETDLALAMSDVVQSTILVEICNGLDDDCDALTDEGFAVGDVCGRGICAGTLQCTADGTTTECVGGALPQTEACNGLDDDCDGLTDEGFPQFCGCLPQAEVCNGADDDCDDLTDEDFTPTACGSDVGECQPGTTACAGGAIDCVGDVGPQPEACNCLDDNCDGTTDSMTTTCFEFASGCDVLLGTCEGTCQIGTHTCTPSSCPMFDECQGDRGPEMEVCDNIDNDCDSVTDDDDLGGGPGSICCGVGVERCNGVDDDCDNLTDESFPEDGLPCGTIVGECEPGAWACVNGMLECLGETGGSPEVCNGLDDDCDGSVDEDVPGVGAPCGDDTGSCEPGLQACVNGTYVCAGAIGPSPETCDCQDNDCDGLLDSDPLEYPTIDCPGAGECRIEFCQCVLPCGEGEFPCPGGFVAVRNGDDCYCEPDVCVGVVCDPGEVCRAIDGEGVCVSLCEDVTCDDHEECENGACVDRSCRTTGCPEGEECIDFTCVPNPCFEVECGDDAFCTEGACCPSRCPAPCAERQYCRVADCEASCRDDPCFDVFCDGLDICVEGDCVPDPCAAVNCPPGLVCCDGSCVNDPCLGASCDENEVCDAAALCRGREPCAPLAISRGETIHLAATGAGGCSCAIASSHSHAPAVALLSLLLVLALGLGRPRRRGRR
jgi:hypothetical protein